MNSPNKFALLLVVALNALTFSMAFAADDLASQQQMSSKSTEIGSTQAPASQSRPTQEVHPKNALPIASGAASAQKTVDARPAKASVTSSESGTFAQAALNSVDEMVRADEPPPKGRSSTASANVLGMRMAEGLAKAKPVQAGTIDEQVYEDGRREERVHTLGGGNYCVTFESPSDPKDGIDKMQYGLHPAGMSNGMSMHSCGHRFDE